MEKTERKFYYAYTIGGDELMVDTSDVLFTPRGRGMKVATISGRQPQKGVVYMNYKNLGKAIPAQTQDEFKRRCRLLLKEKQRQLAHA